MEQSQPSLDREQRLDEIVTAYLKAVEQGQAPDRREWLERHPDLADELEEFFEEQDRLERLAAALRGGLELADRVDAEGTNCPELLGDFRIVREVARGGMGVVYEAEQVSLRRRVAVKVLPFAAALDERLLQRFRNETLAAASLHHGNIVPVHFVGCERGVHFYAMQFIVGHSLAAVLRELRGKSGLLAPVEGPAEPVAGEQAADSGPPACCARRRRRRWAWPGCPPRGRSGARSISTRWPGWAFRWPRHWTMPTSAASFTEMSSQPTSWWTTSACRG